MESALTLQPVERRLSQRRQSLEEHGIVLVRVRPGVEASIVDVSATGVLVETQRRLLPDTSIEIHFERDKQLAAVRGRVLRCAVVRLGPSSVCYRGAVLFDRHLPWLADDHARGYSVLNSEN
jgi:hypothetical protein